MRINGYKLYENNMNAPFHLTRGIYDFMKCDTIQTKVITDGSVGERIIIEDKKIVTKDDKKEFPYFSYHLFSA